MGSSNIIRGFSASHISYSCRLHQSLADDTSPTRGTAQPEFPLTGKKRQIFTLGGSSSDDHEGTQSGREEVSECLLNDDGSIDWEDSVSESDVSSVDEKELFPITNLRPDKLSQPSLLTAMIYQSSSKAAHPAKAIGAGRTRSSPAIQQLHTIINDPTLTTSQDNDNENTPILRDLPVPGSGSDDMSSSSLPIALSPMTTRNNMITDEFDESLKCHLRWEHQQGNATANAALHRRYRAHNVVNLEKCSSQECPNENSQAGQCNNIIPPQSIGTKQSDENKSWNHYFDSGTWEYHSKGW